MKKAGKGILTVVLSMMIIFAFASPAFAETSTSAASENAKEQVTQADNTEDTVTGSKALAAAIAIGLAAAAGAIGMGIAIGKSAEGIARQPEAEGKIRTSLMLGLVFIETAIIYALIVAILVIFVL